MIYFETRTAAKFHVVDNGTSAAAKRRWAIRIEK